MTYADRLGKVLVVTLNGDVLLGVDASSSEGDNRGRLKGLSAWIFIASTFHSLRFRSPFLFHRRRRTMRGFCLSASARHAFGSPNKFPQSKSNLGVVVNKRTFFDRSAQKGTSEAVL